MHLTRTTTSLPFVLGEYELLNKLAEGGVCTIYRGRHRPTGREVAIKVLPQGTARRGMSFRRFEQEFRAAHRLNHPHIVKALDFCGSHTTPYLVMEFIEGESLGAVLLRQGRLPEREAIRLLVDICKGLQHAHEQGVIHRDLKPDNIMLTPGGQAKLTDLGLAKELSSGNDLTRTGRGLGTPHYMAPEQFRDAKNAGVHSDVYGLGATLFHMVTGEIPFGEHSPMEAWVEKMKNKLPPPRQVLPSLSERTEQAILRATRADRLQRQPSCDAFVFDLTGKHLAPSPTPVPDPTVWHLRYAHPSGQEYVLRESTQAVCKLLQMELLSKARFVLLSRSADGPFAPPSQFPEFQGLAPPAQQPPGTRNRPIPVLTHGSAAVPLPGPSRQAVSRTVEQAPPSPPRSPSTPIPLPRVPLHVTASDTEEGVGFGWLLAVVGLGAALAGWYFLFG